MQTYYSYLAYGIVFFLWFARSLNAQAIRSPIKSTTQNNTCKTRTDTKKQVTEKQRTITVTNKITELMKTYTCHWAKPAPSKFTLASGNTLLPQNQTKEIEITNNRLPLIYEVEFKKFGIQYHHEHRHIDFEIPTNQKDVIITFDWYNDYRLLSNNAKAIAMKKLDTNQKTKK